MPDKRDYSWLTVATMSLDDYEVQDRKVRAGCVITRDGNPSVDLLWSGRRYEIEFNRIDTPTKVCAWLVHLAGKSWMDATRLAIFAETCATVNDWPATWRQV